MNILQINASIRAADANSTRVARLVVDRLLARHPDAALSVLDLGANPPAVLDGAALSALFTPADQRTPTQAERVAADDALIAQLQAADVIVLGVPMYNFTIPVQLKSWFDAIARNGVTFRYSANGPEGLLKGKIAYVALARGGRYRDTALDSQVPLIRTFLGFLGITDLHFIYAEGLNMGPEATAQGFAEAEADLARLFD
jgi:FMN-dependent NADH-azoreductase